MTRSRTSTSGRSSRSLPLAVAAIAGALLAASALVTACSESDPHELMLEGDGKAAAAILQKRIDAATPLDPAWIEAKLDRAKALSMYDKAAAQAEGLELVRQYGKELGEKQVGNLATAMSEGGARVEALTVLKATVDLWPESLYLDKVNHHLYQESAAKGDTGLEGLGYVGSDAEQFQPRPGSKTPPEKTLPAPADPKG
jgi:hypothetical protein